MGALNTALAVARSGLSAVATDIRDAFTPGPAQEKRPTGDHRGAARFGYVIILVTFGVFGGWAAFAPLDSAAISPGVLMAQGNRKTVQHLEGGIVRKILIKEGSQVTSGQVMFELDPTQANANLDVSRNQLAALMAQEARLFAERDGAATVSFPDELRKLAAANANLARVIADEEKTFLDRRSTLLGQLAVLNARKSQIGSELEGIERQRRSADQQLAYMDDELAGMRRIYDKGLVPKQRLLEAERSRAGLDGSIGRLIADASKARKAIGETDLQIRQVREEFLQQVSGQVVEVRVKKSELEQRVLVANDLAKRAQIVAPVAGSVQNLRVFTEGAVVRPGEPLADVVPIGDSLAIQAQVSPASVDSVRPNMKAEVRFPTFHSRNLPEIVGTVQSVSRDRLVDETTRQPYFLAVVTVDPNALPDDLRASLTPGIPAEVVVSTGERTLLQYLVEPLTKTLNHALREK
ncbi:MAG: HlyD family type I secretion periplasmic adaptor subunit [Caulobacterales bacterium]